MPVSMRSSSENRIHLPGDLGEASAPRWRPERGIMAEYESADIESAVKQELIAAAGRELTPQQVEALKVKVATIRELNKK